MLLPHEFCACLSLVYFSVQRLQRQKDLLFFAIDRNQDFSKEILLVFFLQGSWRKSHILYLSRHPHVVSQMSAGKKGTQDRTGNKILRKFPSSSPPPPKFLFSPSPTYAIFAPENVRNPDMRGVYFWALRGSSFDLGAAIVKILLAIFFSFSKANSRIGLKRPTGGGREEFGVPKWISEPRFEVPIGHVFLGRAQEVSRNAFGHILRGRGITTILEKSRRIIALDFGTLDIPLLRKLYCAFKKPISAKKIISPLRVSATSSPIPLLRSSSSGSLLLLLRCWCCCHLRRSPPVPPSAFLGLIYFFSSRNREIALLVYAYFLFWAGCQRLRR